MYENLHHLLMVLVGPTVVIINLIALFVAIVTLVKSCYHLFVVDRLNFTQFIERDTLAEGLLTALEIMLLAETMKLMKVATFEDILTLIFLIVIHILLTLVLKKDLQDKKTFRLQEESEKEINSKEKTDQD